MLGILYLVLENLLNYGNRKRPRTQGLRTYIHITLVTTMLLEITRYRSTYSQSVYLISRDHIHVSCSSWRRATQRPDWQLYTLTKVPDTRMRILVSPSYWCAYFTSRKLLRIPVSAGCWSALSTQSETVELVTQNRVYSARVWCLPAARGTNKRYTSEVKKAGYSTKRYLSDGGTIYVHDKYPLP